MAAWGNAAGAGGSWNSGGGSWNSGGGGGGSWQDSSGGGANSWQNPAPAAPAAPAPPALNGFLSNPAGLPGLPRLPAPGAPSFQPPQAPHALGPPRKVITEEIRATYKSLKEDLIKMEAAATEAESNGDDSGANFKRMLMGDMHEKIGEMEKEHPGITQAAPQGPKNVELTQAAAQQAHMQLLAMHSMQPMTFTQQQALLYDEQKLHNTAMDAEVKEFQEKYGLQDRHAFLLNDNLKMRNNTYENDLWHMDEILSKCGNHAQRADLLNLNVRWMVEGKFCGPFGPNEKVIKAAQKFKLDPPSACKLAHSLESRDDPDMDMERINKHLERSNKPSSLVMMFLKTLKAGGQIDENYRSVAIGSWLHKQETSRAGGDKRDDRKGGGKGKGRSRSRRGDRRDDDRGRDRRDDRGRRDDRDDRGRRDDDRGRGRRDDDRDDRRRDDDKGRDRRDDRDKRGSREEDKGGDKKEEKGGE